MLNFIKVELFNMLITEKKKSSDHSLGNLKHTNKKTVNQ